MENIWEIMLRGCYGNCGFFGKLCPEMEMETVNIWNIGSRDGDGKLNYLIIYIKRQCYLFRKEKKIILNP
jgi:hypothetical protein